MGDITVRIPVIENLAMQYGDAFSRNPRPLTPEERKVAQPIFLESINYDVIRIVTTTVAAAPTTLGNHIRILPGYQIPNATLVHELTHIWQFQTKGNGYVSSSLVSQTCAVIATGDRNNAYEYKVIPGQSINRYNAEQQAMIVEDFFSKPLLQKDKEYIRLIGEVRSARPTLTDKDRYLESIYGNQYQNQRYFDPIPPLGRPAGETAPIVRIEF